jgi:NAD(P)-dependent dehydrogenase (short-subunit alcohol dehydrogenase family)
VNIASILGLRVAGAVAPYAVSKAGVVQMTKALALEWAPSWHTRQCAGTGLFRDGA